MPFDVADCAFLFVLVAEIEEATKALDSILPVFVR